jgi:peptidoglycan/xylan/chitin deacetylase (PgdA/CDA1 family)
MNVQTTVSVLAYHSIGAETTKAFRPLTVDPTLFSEHMTALHEHAIDVIPFSAVPEALATRRRAVAVTVDDGLADVAENACPALAALGLTATLFIPSGYIGGRATWLRGADAQRPMLSGSAIADLAREGFEIGSHGRMHLAADVNDPALILNDARASRLALEAIIHGPVRSFAYPFGYHSAAGRAAVQRAGFHQACAVGDLPASRTDDRWALPRLQVFNETSPEALVAMIDRRPSEPVRRWAHAKQRVWHLGRRWAGWGPIEAARLAEAVR